MQTRLSWCVGLQRSSKSDGSVACRLRPTHPCEPRKLLGPLHTCYSGRTAPGVGRISIQSQGSTFERLYFALRLSSTCMYAFSVCSCHGVNRRVLLRRRLCWNADLSSNRCMAGKSPVHPDAFELCNSSFVCLTHLSTRGAASWLPHCDLRPWLADFERQRNGNGLECRVMATGQLAASKCQASKTSRVGRRPSEDTRLKKTHGRPSSGILRPFSHRLGVLPV